MRRRISAIAVIGFLVALTLVGCGGSSTGGASNELDMGSSDFTQTSVTLSAGQALHMVDSQDSGGTHMLCIGQNGICDANPTGPSELHGPGMTFNPGTTKDITFSTAGTYHITCTIHPNMNVTITVQ
jgi:plastocyanin